MPHPLPTIAALWMEGALSYLEQLCLKSFVDAGHKVVTDTSVGNVCKHAQSGDVDVAFVYTSDVYRFGGVQIVGTVPANTHKNIVYPGAVTSESKNAAATQEFLDWCLSSDKAQEIWQKWGFELA